MLFDMRRSYLYLLSTTLSRSVSSIWSIMHLMGELSILVWNCDGLNIPHKRTSVLTLLKRRRIDIALLQETHLLKKDSARMANRFYHTIAASSADSKSRGVAIVCKCNLKIKVLDTWAHNNG